jgi:hypothetical protein
MNKLKFNKESMHKLYGGSEKDIYFILCKFSKDILVIKESLLNAFRQADRQSLILSLHANYPGFAYTGFPDISIQIKNIFERCKSINRIEEIHSDFAELLINIDQCKEICDAELENLSKLPII